VAFALFFEDAVLTLFAADALRDPLYPSSRAEPTAAFKILSRFILVMPSVTPIVDIPTINILHHILSIQIEYSITTGSRPPAVQTGHAPYRKAGGLLL
jgi:hypothetical protein